MQKRHLPALHVPHGGLVRPAWRQLQVFSKGHNWSIHLQATATRRLMHWCAVAVASFWKPKLHASQAFQKAWRRKGGCPCRTNPLPVLLFFLFRAHYSAVPPGIASAECCLIVSCTSFKSGNVVGQNLGKRSSLLKPKTSPLHTAGPKIVGGYGVGGWR